MSNLVKKGWLLSTISLQPLVYWIFGVLGISAIALFVLPVTVGVSIVVVSVIVLVAYFTVNRKM